MKKYNLKLTKEEVGDLLDILYDSPSNNVSNMLYTKVDELLEYIFEDENKQFLKNIPLPEESI